MSGASSGRLERDYYAIAIEDMIRYDFDEDADDFYASVEQAYHDDLVSLASAMDTQLEALRLRCPADLCPYQVERFEHGSVVQPYYAELLSMGNAPLSSRYPFAESTPNGVVLRGLLQPQSGRAGRFLNLELVVSGSLKACELVQLYDMLEAAVTEQLCGDDYLTLAGAKGARPNAVSHELATAVAQDDPTFDPFAITPESPSGQEDGALERLYGVDGRPTIASCELTVFGDEKPK